MTVIKTVREGRHVDSCLSKICKIECDGKNPQLKAGASVTSCLLLACLLACMLPFFNEAMWLIASLNKSFRDY